MRKLKNKIYDIIMKSIIITAITIIEISVISWAIINTIADYIRGKIWKRK